MTYDDDDKHEDEFKQGIVARMVKLLMTLVCVIAVAVTVGVIYLFGVGILWFTSMALGL